MCVGRTLSYTKVIRALLRSDSQMTALKTISSKKTHVARGICSLDTWFALSVVLDGDEKGVPGHRGLRTHPVAKRQVLNLSGSLLPSRKRGKVSEDQVQGSSLSQERDSSWSVNLFALDANNSHVGNLNTQPLAFSSSDCVTNVVSEAYSPTDSDDYSTSTPVSSMDYGMSEANTSTDDRDPLPASDTADGCHDGSVGMSAASTEAAASGSLSA